MNKCNIMSKEKLEKYKVIPQIEAIHEEIYDSITNFSKPLVNLICCYVYSAFNPEIFPYCCGKEVKTLDVCPVCFDHGLLRMTNTTFILPIQCEFCPSTYVAGNPHWLVLWKSRNIHACYVCYKCLEKLGIHDYKNNYWMQSKRFYDLELPKHMKIFCEHEYTRPVPVCPIYMKDIPRDYTIWDTYKLTQTEKYFRNFSEPIQEHSKKEKGFIKYLFLEHLKNIPSHCEKCSKTLRKCMVCSIQSHIGKIENATLCQLCNVRFKFKLHYIRDMELGTALSEWCFC